MFKRLLFLILLGYAGNTMAETLANETLKHDTLNAVGGVKTILNVKGRKCAPQLKSAKVLQEPTDMIYQDGVSVSGYWREEWTIQCGDEVVRMPVKFIINETGTSWAITTNDLKFRNPKKEKEMQERQKQKKLEAELKKREQEMKKAQEDKRRAEIKKAQEDKRKAEMKKAQENKKKAEMKKKKKKK